MTLCSDFFKESSIRISSSTTTPVPTVRAAHQCQQFVLPTSANSSCCQSVLGFGFRAPARAPTFSEISSYSYKVTGFQKRLSKKDYFKEKTEANFISPQHLSDLLVSPQWVLPALGQAFRQVSHQTT